MTAKVALARLVLPPLLLVAALALVNEEALAKKQRRLAWRRAAPPGCAAEGSQGAAAWCQLLPSDRLAVRNPKRVKELSVQAAKRAEAGGPSFEQESSDRAVAALHEACRSGHQRFQKDEKARKEGRARKSAQVHRLFCNANSHENPQTCR